MKYKNKPQPTCFEEFKANLRGYLLMLWDGVGFFGTDHFKLGRLVGEKVNFLTPFKSTKFVIIFGLGMLITIYILVTEISRVGNQKSQTISFVRNDYYEYHFSEAIPLLSCNWFYVDEIFTHIRNQQLKNLEETDQEKRDKLRDHRILPEGITFDELSYDDRMFIEEYFCNRTKMYYYQRSRYDAIGTEAYENQFYFYFKCELLPFADNKIRVKYNVPINDVDYNARFINSIGRLEPLADDATTTVYYKRSSEFRAEIVCSFDEDLHGLRSQYALFHTQEGKN